MVIKSERINQMKQLYPKITCVAITVLFALAQVLANASVAVRVGNLQSANSVESCGKCDGVPVTEPEAVKTLLEAAEHGDVKAQFELGRRYEYGNGVATNVVEAVKWFRKAAEQGYALAQLTLGRCYSLGEDEVEARKWYRRAVEQYRQAAEQGDGEAQCKLGDCYRCGHGTNQDQVEAVKWYRKAAEQGNVEAQSWLGYYYLRGKGVKQDDVEAVKWYRKAAKQGVAGAQFQLGDCYRYGKGINRDDVEAAKWYLKAVGQGHYEAHIKLGDCYLWGEGVEKNSAEAVEYYKKVIAYDERRTVYLGIAVSSEGKIVKQYIDIESWDASGVCSLAMLRLAYCYEHGIGVKKDVIEAARLIRRVIDSKGIVTTPEAEKEAMLRLASFYVNGVGMEKSSVEAMKWWFKAWWIDHPVRKWWWMHGHVVFWGIVMVIVIYFVYVVTYKRLARGHIAGRSVA